MKKIKFIIFILICFGSGIFLKKIYEERINYLPKSQIKFENNFYDFGMISKKEDIYFKYSNKGKENLVISSVSNGCGCVISKFKSDILKPKQMDSLLITYIPQKEGKFKKDIYIFSNSVTSPDVLHIKGFFKEKIIYN